MPDKVELANINGFVNLPAIDDDHNQFYCIQIWSENLGAPVEFKNLTLLELVNNTKDDGLKELRGKKKTKVLKYSEKYN